MTTYGPILIACLLPLGGCISEHNRYYCKGAPLDNCTLIDAGGGGPTRCTADNQCLLPTATVCDLPGSGTCVQCTMSEHDACLGATPACVDNTCQTCTAHAQCSVSNVCLPDGTCADPTQVAYVDGNGSDNPSCSLVTPCTKVMKALATNRPYVKFHGTTDDVVSINGGRIVTFLADPGATLTRGTGNGAIVTVQDSGTSLSVYDLSISNAPNNPSAIGCVIPPALGAPTLSLTRATIANNPGGGILMSAGTVAVTQSTISGSDGIGISATGGMLTVSQSKIIGNIGGGVTISDAQFDIRNNFIVQNGGMFSGVGGVDITQILVAGTHRLDFNTITDNAGTSSFAVNTGVNCSSIGVPLALDSNIIFANLVTGGGKQIGGSVMCTATHSDVGDLAAGPSNINMDPLFVNPVRHDFHLMATSPAKDAANPSAVLDVDFDGDPRPQGPHADMGADEIRQ